MHIVFKLPQHFRLTQPSSVSMFHIGDGKLDIFFYKGFYLYVYILHCSTKEIGITPYHSSDEKYFCIAETLLQGR